MDSKIYESLKKEVTNLVIEGIKRNLRNIQRDHRKGKNSMSLHQEYEQLKDHYLKEMEGVFKQIESEMMLKGLVQYSEYVEPKEDEPEF